MILLQISDAITKAVNSGGASTEDWKLYVTITSTIVSLIALFFSYKMYKQARLSTRVTGNYNLLEKNKVILYNLPHCK